MKNFKKNLLISIRRSLRENEVALGISLGLLIACIGLLIMHIQDNNEAIMHAAPQEVVEEIIEVEFIEDKFYEAPGRAITAGDEKESLNLEKQNELTL